MTKTVMFETSLTMFSNLLLPHTGTSAGVTIKSETVIGNMRVFNHYVLTK